MKKKPKKNIEEALADLREFIDSPSGDDSQKKIEHRIAYSVEQAIRWVTLDTVGWPKPLEMAKHDALLLKKELGL